MTISVKARSIVWGEERQPNKEIGYNHVIGETPIGDFEVTWKGWKEHPSYGINHTTMGWIDSESTLDDAKATAQAKLNAIVASLVETDV